MYRQSFVPVKQGDEFEVKIEAVGEKGDGLAKKDGFVIFVPNTKPGDTVRVRITRVLRKVSFAEVIGQSSGTEAPEKTAAKEGDAEEQSEDEEGYSEDADDSEDSEDSEDFGEDES